MEEQDASRELARLLERHREAILSAWANRVIDLPGSHYRQHPRWEVARWLKEGIEAVIESLAQPSDGPLDAHIRRIGPSRRALGFGIAEVIESLLLLREAAWPHVRHLPTAPLDSCVRKLASGFAARYADLMRQSLEEAADRTRRQLAESRGLQQVVTALLDQVGLTAMLDIVCREARNLTGASGSAVFLLDESGGPEVAFHSEIAVDHAAELLGLLPSTPPSEPVVSEIPVGLRSIGRLSESSESLLAVPLRGHEHRIGVLVLVGGPPAFSQEDIRVCGLFSDQAAIAIEHEQLHEQLRRMAVVEERQKLARDLHDSVSQALYSVTLFAEASARLLRSGNIPKASEHLHELGGIALEGLRDMRLLIYELRPASLEQEGLIGALKARLSSVEERSGLSTEFEGGGIGRLAQALEEDLHRIAQEALNNVLKHAHASRVSVALRRERGNVVLEIADNGVGFDAATEANKGGLGLRGMRERAERLGGRVKITARVGSGTRVEVDVPLTRAPGAVE